MTHLEHTAASGAADRETLPADGYSGRAARARTEPMTVYPLRDGRYAVDTDGGSYVVDLREGRCRCPDYDYRGTRCKHLRRVAIEVTEGRVAPPGRRRAACAVCGDRLYVPVDDERPFLCGEHRHAPGEVVVDRETGQLLVVAGPPGDRADGVVADGRAISDFATNANYGGHEPVVPAVYVESLGPTDAVEDGREYSFPASRLRTTGRRHGSLFDAERDGAASAAVA
ncbi:MAG: SWIM zinc finger family protein [Halolamina sp.]